MLYEIVGELHKEGFQSERFDRVSNFASQISIIPISAKTGEGVIEVLAMLLGLAQEYLTEQLEIDENAPAKGTVLEIKEETGQDYEIDRLLFIHENFFQQSSGKLVSLNCHEISFYYLMKSKGQQFPSFSAAETVEWIPLDRMDEYQAYPNFLAKLVSTQPTGIKRVITKDEKHTILSL